MPITLAALGGLITGSFLNVVAYRLPRGESLLFPASPSTSCSSHIKHYEDVKLTAVLGLCLARYVALAILAGVALGAIMGALIMARRGVAVGRKTALPFGPFLAAGGVLALLAGPAILHWYLHLAH